MKVLLDTPVFLWAIMSPEQLSDEATELLSDNSCEKYLSAASAWEITVKAGKGYLSLPVPPEEFLNRSLAASGIIGLPVTIHDAVAVIELPHHHEDVFDRQLIAQARRHKMFLMTADPVFERYDVQIIST